MKRFFQVGSALMLSALLVASAYAVGFKVDVYCDGPGNGAANIAATDGSLTINMNNLPPNTGFECGVECLAGPDGSFYGWCSSNNKGHFSASFPKALPYGCLAPVAFVNDNSSSTDCASGVIGEPLF